MLVIWLTPLLKDWTKWITDHVDAASTLAYPRARSHTKKYLACLNSMPKIPGCPHTSGHILQCVSQHALLAILTHNQAP